MRRIPRRQVQRVWRERDGGSSQRAEFGIEPANLLRGAFQLSGQQIGKKRLQPGRVKVIHQGTRPLRELGVEVAAEDRCIDVNAWEAHALIYCDLRARA